MANESPPTRSEGSLRVLMVSNMYPNATNPGYGIYVYDQVEELRKLGLTIDLLVTNRKPTTSLGRFAKYAEHFFSAWWNRRSACDVVHLHFPAASHLLAASPVLLLSGRPYVVTIHRGELHDLPESGIQRWLVSRFLRAAQGVIVVSRELAELAGSRLGVRADRLNVIDVGFNGELFKPCDSGQRRALRKKLGFSEQRFSLLFVGVLEQRKGLAVLFDALERLGDRVAVELHIAGIGSSEAQLKEAAQRHPLGEHIHWLGIVPHANLSELYCAADALVLPSYSEGTPTVLLETMASGTPAILTRVGGVPDIIEHGRNGLLFEPGAALALRNLIEQLAADRDLGRRLAAQALRDVQDHSLRRQVMRIEKVYRTVIRPSVEAGG